MKIIILAIFAICLSSCSRPFDEIINFESASEYSTDIGHFEFLKTVPRVIDGKRCTYPVRKYRAIKIFKGSLQAGDVIELHGDVDSYENMESERILFISNTSSADTFSTEKCDIEMFESYKGINNWCCNITTDSKTSEKFVVLYKMVNSEQKGPDILVPLISVYKELERLE